MMKIPIVAKQELSYIESSAISNVTTGKIVAGINITSFAGASAS